MASELDEIRQQFPDYANWSDQKLGRALKKKAQPDMPDDQYWSELGVDPNALTLGGKPFPEQRNEQQFQPSDYETPGAALVEGGMRLPERVGGMVKGIATGVADLPNNSIQDYGNSAMQGLAGGAEVLANVPNNFVEYLRKHQAEEKIKKAEFEKNHPILSKVGSIFGRESSEDTMQIPDWVKAWKPGKETTQTLKDAQKYWEPENPEAPANQLIKGVSQFVPSLIATGGNPYAAAVVNSVGENKNVFEDLIPFLAEKPARYAAGKGIDKLKSLPLTPSEMYANKFAKQGKGLLSPEELDANMRATEGTNTGLGDVIGSPRLKKQLENELLPKAVSSDAILKELDQQVKGKTESAVNNANKGIIAEDTNALTKSLLEASAKETTKIKNELYKPVSQLAESEGLTFELPSFKKIASENAAAIADSPMLKNNSEFNSLYNKLTKLGKTTESKSPGTIGANGLVTPPKVKTSSLADIKLILNELGKEGAQMQKSLSVAEQSQGKLLSRLAEAGRNDIRDVINTKGSPKAQEAYKKAEDYYSSEYSKFLDRDIHKLIQNKDYQSIVHEIIKPGKAKDQHILIDKVMELLPEEQRGVLGATYLNRAIDKYGVLQPHEVTKLVDALGPRQFQSLFPDKAIRQSLLDLKTLKNMNSEALTRWVNAKTGQRTLPDFANLLSGKSATFAGIAGAAMFGYPGAVIGGALGSALPAIKANYLAKLMTDQKFRERVANKIRNTSNMKPKKPNSRFTNAEFSKAIKDVIIAETAAQPKESKE